MKLDHFDFAGGALNEADSRKRHGIGRKKFRAGIRLLKQAKVLDRAQPNHRHYAVETIAERSEHYVALDRALLSKDSALIAFIAAVNLSPKPIRPEQAAKRIGIESRPTIRRLSKAAIVGGHVSFAIVAHGQQWLARKGCDIDKAQLGGHAFDHEECQMEKKVLAKKVPTHSNREQGTDSERTTQTLKEAAISTPPDAARREERLQHREIEFLTDWRASHLVAAFLALR